MDNWTSRTHRILMQHASAKRIKTVAKDQLLALPLPPVAQRYLDGFAGCNNWNNLGGNSTGLTPASGADCLRPDCTASNICAGGSCARIAIIRRSKSSGDSVRRCHSTRGSDDAEFARASNACAAFGIGLAMLKVAQAPAEVRPHAWQCA